MNKKFLLFLNIVSKVFDFLLLVAGCGLVVYGVRMINEPASFVVAGFLFICACFLDKNTKNKTDGE